MTERITEDNKAINVFTGNLVPHEWYSIIINRWGKPDTVAILILAEIIYWWRPVKAKDNKTGGLASIKHKFKGDAWQTSYEYFFHKFGFSHDYTRKILIRLERLRILRREHRTITLKSGVRCPHTLFIKLNEDFLNNGYSLLKKDNLNPNKVSDKSLRHIRQIEGDVSDKSLRRIRQIRGGVSDKSLRRIRQIKGDVSDKSLRPLYASIPYTASPSRQSGYNIDYIDIDLDKNKKIDIDKDLDKSKKYSYYSYRSAEFLKNEFSEELNLDHGRDEPSEAEQPAPQSESEFLSVASISEFKSEAEAISEFEPEDFPLTSTTPIDETGYYGKTDQLQPEQLSSGPKLLKEVIAGILSSVPMGQTSKTDDAATINPAINSAAPLPPTKKTIAEFELSEEDARQLRVMSGREFSTNFINELKNKLAVRYPQNAFETRERFLKYLAKTLSNEKHDEVKTAHESFRLKCNMENAHENLQQPERQKQRAGNIEEYIAKQPPPWQKILRIMFEEFNCDVSCGWFAKVGFIAYDEAEHTLKLSDDKNVGGLVLQHNQFVFLKSVSLAYPEAKYVELGDRRQKL